MTNRNLCIAASLCCFLGGGLPAQRPSAFGVTAGINLASVSGSAEDASNRTGLRLGVFMIRTLVPGVQLQPEAVFTSKGAAYDNVDLVINYLQVPVLIRVELPTASAGLVPYGVIGPALALRIGCDLRASNGDTVECGPNSTDVSTTDLSIILGAGAQFGAMGVSVRYDLGVININEGVNDVNTETITIEFSYALSRR